MRRYNTARLVEPGTRYGLLIIATSYVTVELRSDASLRGAEQTVDCRGPRRGFGASA